MTHDVEMLGAYSLGILDDDERSSVDEHLAQCEQCRAELASLRRTVGQLATVPAEWVAPAAVGRDDLVLRRTLRDVRAGRSQGRTRLVTAVAAAAVALVALSGVTGLIVGRQTAPDQRIEALPPDPPGTRHLTATAATTGAGMAATIRPAANWVRLNAKVTGVPEGTRCRLVVVTKAGARESVGSWEVSKKGATEGTGIDAAAAVPLDQVASLEVQTLDGKPLVSVAT
jgi:hypothetical protein